MRGRAGARRAVVELARIRAHVFGQLLERFRGYARRDYREQRSVGEHGYAIGGPGYLQPDAQLGVLIQPQKDRTLYVSAEPGLL